MLNIQKSGWEKTFNRHFCTAGFTRNFFSEEVEQLYRNILLKKKTIKCQLDIA